MDENYVLRVFDKLIKESELLGQNLHEIWCSPDLYKLAPKEYKGKMIYTGNFFNDKTDYAIIGDLYYTE